MENKFFDINLYGTRKVRVYIGKIVGISTIMDDVQSGHKYFDVYLDGIQEPFKHFDRAKMITEVRLKLIEKWESLLV
jgi:hypothetical protein